MPRLLRLHLSSIGHKDARLAPVTLDFRHVGTTGKEGSGADSVLWLRNGGGKSTIINLFYSVFRPNRREFLGASAEGKARRLDDYVKGSDLAFVVSEWDVSPAKDSAALRDQEPEHVRLVGQALAWKGQRRSSDPSDLRRIFFSLRAVPGELGFEDMPIVGLGDPVDSLDAFRAWLRDMTTRHPGLEIVDTENHSRWQSHLDRIGLDTELFRYQLTMNRREGAADEIFRFTSSQAFVDFLLGLTFDVEIANQLAKNLEAQRDRLRKRPGLEAEQQFVARVLDALATLLAALRAEADRRAELDRTVKDLAALVSGLDARAEELDRAHDEQLSAASQAAEEARVASNQREKVRRWMRGLQRRALELQLRDARAAHVHASELAEAARRELGEARAAAALQDVQGLEAQVKAWGEALRASELELEPTRVDLEARGGRLRAVLGRAAASASTEADRQGREIARLNADAQRHDEVRRQADLRHGALQQEAADLDRQLERRDRARERLVGAGVVEAREPADTAAARWTERRASVMQQIDLRRMRAAEVAEELRTLAARALELTGDDARLAAQRQEQARLLEAGRGWRDRLMSDAGIVEVEETDEPSLETPGLSDRLRQRAEAARHRYLRSRVDAAEDERAISAVDRDGLLPGPGDVDDVVRRLHREGVNAHTGLSYLAENLPLPHRLARLVSDPGRYAGVLVIDEADDRARAVLGGVVTKHVPVQVSIIDAHDTDSSAQLESSLVVAPHPGTFDRAAAAERRGELETTREQRRREEAELRAEERAFDELAAEVRRFLAEYGHGKLREVEEAHDALISQSDRIQRELADVVHRKAAREAESDALRTELEALAEAMREADSALAALVSFIDEHERHVDAARQRKQVAEAERRAAERTAVESADSAATLRGLAGDARERQRSAETSAVELRREREAVAYFSEHATASGDLSEARASYDTLCRSYEKQVGDSQAKWELKRAADDLASARQRYDELSSSHEEAAIRAWLDEEHLPSVIQRLDQDHGAALGKQGIAKGNVETASRALEETEARLRREAADLPPEGAAIDSVASARDLALAYEAQAEAHGEAQRRAEAAEKQANEAARSAETRSLKHKDFASSLRARAHASDLVLQSAPPVPLIEDLTRVQALVDDAAGKLDRTRRELEAAVRESRTCLNGVRSIANATRFADLTLQYRERLKSDDDELRERAVELHERLGVRACVIEQELQQFDKDRKILVLSAREK